MNMEKFIKGYDELKKINFHDAKILQFDNLIKLSIDNFINVFVVIPDGSLYLLKFIEIESIDLSFNNMEKEGFIYINTMSFQRKDENIECKIVCHESDISGFINILASKCECTPINTTICKNHIFCELTKQLSSKTDKIIDKEIDEIFAIESDRLPEKIIMKCE